MDAIVTDEKILRQKSDPVTLDQIRDLKLNSRLRQAVKNAWTKGCGLAAIQIGIPLRYAWFSHNGKDYELINPEIIKAYGYGTAEEGCLSIPNKWIKVKRAATIEYTSNGKKKVANGFVAIVVQHEIDHMNGILNIDKQEQKDKNETS